MTMLASIFAMVGGAVANGVEGAVQYGTQAWLVMAVLQLSRDVAELKGKKR